MIKKDLLDNKVFMEAPDNAEIWISQRTLEDYEEAEAIDYDKESNVIVIC